jgi:hypothetical protein
MKRLSSRNGWLDQALINQASQTKSSRRERRGHTYSRMDGVKNGFDYIVDLWMNHLARLNYPHRQTQSQAREIGVHGDNPSISPSIIPGPPLPHPPPSSKKEWLPVAQHERTQPTPLHLSPAPPPKNHRLIHQRSANLQRQKGPPNGVGSKKSLKTVLSNPTIEIEPLHRLILLRREERRQRGGIRTVPLPRLEMKKRVILMWVVR